MTTTEQRVIGAIDHDDLIDLLKALVAVPSPVGHEGLLADVIGAWLDANGLEVAYQSVDGDRKNVIGTYRFSNPGPCLMFNGHLDTVAPSSPAERDPFRATIEDGKMYGLGALDMKGGIAASLMAIKTLIGIGKTVRGSLIFSGVIDEEGYSSGARALLDGYVDNVDAAIIGEPCGTSEFSPIPLVTAGKVLYRLTVKGVQAHGFTPQDGVNAVEEAARIVAALDRLRQTRHASLGTGPVSTLKITGGYEEYEVVVPDRCEVIISRMTVPGENSEQCRQDLEDLIESLGLAARATVEMVPPYYSPLVTDRSCRLFREFEAVHQLEFGKPAHYGSSNVITDASVFSGEAGIPTLVFGPSGGGIHQANEHIDLGSLQTCTRAYARTALRYLGTVGV